MRGGNKLTAMAVQRAKKTGLYGDGLGLWLRVGPCGTKSWILRYMIGGRPRSMGLGPLHSVTLSEARERAREARLMVKRGEDPLGGNRASSRGLTFDACAERFIEAHAPDWKNAAHRAQWSATLTTYASPVIGSVPVSAVDTASVMAVLQPIWRKTPETASRLRGRIERILDWAAVQGYRRANNPARWKGHLDKALPARSKVKAKEHHPALAYEALPGFMAELGARDGVSAKALEFTILTASRTGEVIGARWEEIDLKAYTWTVPAARMKSGREHRVPLSDRAAALLQALPRKRDEVFVNGGDKPLSNMAMLELLKGMMPGLTVHGFRSTFSDWARDRTHYPRDVIEQALAHVIKDKSEAAYRRGDALEKRRLLMADFANYASDQVLAGEVVKLHA